MKKQLRRILPLFLAFLMFLCTLSPVHAEEELKYMAYNFYSAPDLSRTSGRFDSFMIDFRSDKAPLTTYWSLANFAMDTGSTQTRRAYPGISGYGAYAGLQHSTKRVGILSFWEAAYVKDGEKAILRASRIYPAGNSTFGGEGEGTNCIASYEWQNDRWYRMLLHSWEDEETGTTFAGLWFLDVESGEWTLFSYFDTHLYKSYFVGAMSQFMENYWGADVNTNCNVERTCNLKNMYVFDHIRKSWVSLPTATLSYGDGNPVNEDQRKFGAHSFGATDEYFWGSTGGKVEDQEAYEAAATKYSVHTINQPKKPTLGAPVLETLRMGGELSWELAQTSAPQLSYTIKVVDSCGKVLFEKTATRPEVRAEALPEDLPAAVKATLTVTDVFGGTATAEIATDAYKEAVPDDENPPSPSADEGLDSSDDPVRDPSGEQPALPSGGQSPDSPTTPQARSGSVTVLGMAVGVAALVGIAIGTSLLIAVVITVVVIAKKKKKRK